MKKEGGKHSGFYKNYVGRSSEEIRKGIISLEKQIQEHQEKIADPSKYIPKFHELDPRQKDALVNKKWPNDIQRQKEQLDILRHILKEKGS